MITYIPPDRKGNRSIKVITQPAIEPITLEELKEFARITHQHEDSLLNSFIVSARKSVENYLRKKLIEQTLRLQFDIWADNDIIIPYPPLISVTGIYYVYEDDTTDEYSSSYYYVDNNQEPGKVVIKNGNVMPVNTDRYTGGYRIDYKAGYGDAAEDVPDNIKTAIKIWATELYEGRATDTAPPHQAKNILRHERIEYI